eukprot:363862-Chlamydomonas_euryale.AAC.3
MGWPTPSPPCMRRHAWAEAGSAAGARAAVCTARRGMRSAAPLVPCTAPLCCCAHSSSSSALSSTAAAFEFVMRPHTHRGDMGLRVRGWLPSCACRSAGRVFAGLQAPAHSSGAVCHRSRH